MLHQVRRYRTGVGNAPSTPADVLAVNPNAFKETDPAMLQMRADSLARIVGEAKVNCTADLPVLLATGAAALFLPGWWKLLAVAVGGVVFTGAMGGTKIKGDLMGNRWTCANVLFPIKD